MQDEDRQRHFPLQPSRPSSSKDNNKNINIEIINTHSPTSSNASSSSSNNSSPTNNSFPSHQQPPQIPQPPAAACLLPSTATSSSNAHTRRSSLQSITKMPPIREDAYAANTSFSLLRAASSASTSTANHRTTTTTAPFQYHYGEDYITAYERVGLTPSPSPRPASRTSMRSSPGPTAIAEAPPPSTQGAPAGSERSVETEEALMEKEKEEAMAHHQRRRGDVETGGGIGADEKGGSSSLGFWRRWRRTVVFALVVLVLAGLGVGLAFGLR